MLKKIITSDNEFDNITKLYTKEAFCLKYYIFGILVFTRRYNSNVDVNGKINNVTGFKTNKNQ